MTGAGQRHPHQLAAGGKLTSLTNRELVSGLSLDVDILARELRGRLELADTLPASSWRDPAAAARAAGRMTAALEVLAGRLAAGQETRS